MSNIEISFPQYSQQLTHCAQDIARNKEDLTSDSPEKPECYRAPKSHTNDKLTRQVDHLSNSFIMNEQRRKSSLRSNNAPRNQDSCICMTVYPDVRCCPTGRIAASNVPRSHPPHAALLHHLSCPVRFRDFLKRSRYTTCRSVVSWRGK